MIISLTSNLNKRYFRVVFFLCHHTEMEAQGSILKSKIHKSSTSIKKKKSNDKPQTQICTAQCREYAWFREHLFKCTCFN